MQACQDKTGEAKGFTQLTIITALRILITHMHIKYKNFKEMIKTDLKSKRLKEVCRSKRAYLF